MREVLIQGIGFVGVIFYIVSYQVKSNRGLYFCQILGSVSFTVQFILLGGIIGSLGLLITILRNFLLSRIEAWPWVKSKMVAAGIIVLSTAATLCTWDGWLNLLPWLAVTGSTIGYWTNNARTIRLSNLICSSPCWLLYDIAVGSIGGIVSELITLCSILVSIYRYGWKALGENQFSESQKKES